MSHAVAMFELQVYTDRGWSPLQNFETREDALAMARALNDRQRYKSVKVVTEIFDEAKGLFIPRTIYKDPPLIDESLVKNRKIERSIDHMLQRHQNRKRAVQQAKAQRWQKRRHKLRTLLFGLGLLFKLSLIVGSGVWALVALRDII